MLIAKLRLRGNSIEDFEHSPAKRWLTIGGVVGDPGPRTFTSWFRIEKVELYSDNMVYKFSFCSSGSTLCNDVGKYVWVRLTKEAEEPFVFVKAYVANTAGCVGKQP
ncbi:hypothetical protein V6N13_077496 [Hibiscus sabdariffa]|uniref:Uncharacterized protein n=1 Tax=Hibiscus sabdariffa TaxID=183260 RepID=A0ABR2CRD3_9ROSI